MGTLASKDTRRISFDNKFALSAAAIVAVPKAIEDKSLIHFDDIVATESGSDLLFDGTGKAVEVLEESNTDYWAHRMEKLKKEHQAINKIIEIEYNKQIESTNEVYSIPKVTQERLQKIKPCFEWRTKVLASAGNGRPTVYKIDCSCGGFYEGQTKRTVAERVKEHISEVKNRQVNKSAMTEYVVVVDSGLNRYCNAMKKIIISP